MKPCKDDVRPLFERKHVASSVSEELCVYVEHRLSDRQKDGNYFMDVALLVRNDIIGLGGLGDTS